MKTKRYEIGIKETYFELLKMYPIKLYIYIGPHAPRVRIILFHTPFIHGRPVYKIFTTDLEITLFLNLAKVTTALP